MKKYICFESLLLYDVDHIHCVCDCGSGDAFRNTNLDCFLCFDITIDRLLHSNIIFGLGTTFWYANILNSNSLRGLII